MTLDDKTFGLALFLILALLSVWEVVYSITEHGVLISVDNPYAPLVNMLALFLAGFLFHALVFDDE